MRIVKTIFITLLGILPVIGMGQELPFYSNYTVNPLVYNPANAGYSGELDLFLHHRTQWSGFKGSPVSQLFTMSAPIRNINSGLGISFQNDRRGLFNVVTGSLKYAYHAKINQKSGISFGVGLDIQNRLLRLGESTVMDIDDPMVNKGSTSETFFDASLGIEYHFDDKLTIGFSVPQLLQGTQSKENSMVENSRYFIGQASYMIKATSSGNLKVQPVVLVRYSQNVPLQYDANALIHYKDKFMVGVGYRNNYAVNFHAGVNIKNFKVRYVYDFATVNSNINAGLSHEITLGYTIATGSGKNATLPADETLYSEEMPSAAEIQEILNLLIDEFFDSPNQSQEDLERVQLLRDTIMRLLENFNKIK